MRGQPLVRALIIVWVIAAFTALAAILIVPRLVSPPDRDSPSTSSPTPSEPSELPVPDDALHKAPPSDAGQTLNLILGVIAVLALGVAWNQLRLQRNAQGGKGVLVENRAHRGVDGRYFQFDVKVHMVGPAVRHQVGLDLEKGGRAFKVGTEKPAVRTSMGCNDDPIVWTFHVPEHEMSEVWLIVTWVEARADNLRSEAGAWRLGPPPDIYLWKWYPGWKVAVWVQMWAAEHGPKKLRAIAGRPRATGWWHNEGSASPAGALPGQGPLELGRPPGG